MLFNSLAFFIFFPIVTALYYLLPHSTRWLLLLVASCVFYMFFVPLYILILFFTIVVDYVAGIAMENGVGKRRKLIIITSIISNIGVLAIFKYYDFAAVNLNALAQLLHWNYSISLLEMILPIGLSFHTFQAMAYTVEVYRGRQRAERHFGIYALYVMFYPQLVAGPIERPQNLLHQFREKHEFDYARVVDGLRQMAWGLFKKAVIADRIASVVDPVYAAPETFSAVSIVMATVLYAYQIYCDFSGYSDIALGAAQVMGFKLMTNFRQPYQARSVKEFWQRWHISLSTWFRDYLYIPLGGNRVSPARLRWNLLIVFLFSGIWHGANWTFIVWGALHGFYLVASSVLEPMRRRLVHWSGVSKTPFLHAALQVSMTFLFVCFAWIFFRAPSVASALYIAKQSPFGLVDMVVHPAGIIQSVWDLGLSRIEFVTLGLSILFVEAAESLQGIPSARRLIGSAPVYLRWAGYYALSYVILRFGNFGVQPFIYFQF